MLMNTELGRQLPMVAHLSRRSSGSKLDIGKFRSIRYSEIYRNLFPCLTRSHGPHHRTLRRRILCRAYTLGSSIRDLWPKTHLHPRLHLLYRISSRLRLV